MAEPLPRIVQTDDTCWGARRFEHTRLPIDTFVPLVIRHGYTQAYCEEQYPTFPAGGVEVIWQVYEREKAEWDAAWFRAEAAAARGDCCEAETALRELLALREHLEWSAVAWGEHVCPVCYCIPRDGHDADCALLGALQRADAALKEET